MPQARLVRHVSVPGNHCGLRGRWHRSAHPGLRPSLSLLTLSYLHTHRVHNVANWCVVVYVFANHARTGTAECWLAFPSRGIAHSSRQLQSWYLHPHVCEHRCVLISWPMLIVLFTSADDARHDDTLQRIYSAANEDVEMKVSRFHPGQAFGAAVTLQANCRMPLSQSYTSYSTPTFS